MQVRHAHVTGVYGVCKTLTKTDAHLAENSVWFVYTLAGKRIDKT